MVDENEKVNNVCIGRLACDKWGGCFSHHLSFHAHDDLPNMLNQALRDFGCIVIHIVALQPIGVSRRAFTHDFDGASPVAQLKHITLPQL